MLLGLGYPRMQTDKPGSDGHKGQSALNILNINVTVAGVMFEDTNTPPRTMNTPLLELGALKGDGRSDGAHLYDVLVRLTTDQYASAKDPFGFYPSIEVYGSKVIGDNLWLWAKDIDNSQKSWAANGLEINGDKDVMFGLAVEHFYGYQTQWNGDIWKISFELLNATGIEFRILTIDGGQCVIFKKQKETYIPDCYHEFKDLPFEYFFNNFYSLPVINLENGLNWLKVNLATP